MPLPPPPPRNRSNNLPVCSVHKSTGHATSDCRDYLAMNAQEKIDVIKNNGLCYSCLISGHRSFQCKTRKKCGINQCDKFHHSTLHQGSIEGLGFHTAGFPSTSSCLLQVMTIRSTHDGTSNGLTVFFDGGATISLITFSAARRLGLQGKEIILSVTKVGGVKENLKSFVYVLQLLDKNNEVVEFQVYGIEKISTELKSMNIQGVLHLFRNAGINEIERPTGEIDALIGFEYAGFHPVAKQKSGHLLLMSNRFGKCLGGSHKLLAESTEKIIEHANVHHMKGEVTIEDFYKMEAMGVNCNPKCGSCKCGQCSVGGKDYTLKEERELKMIEQGLTHEENHWVAKYPWLRDPFELKNNYKYAYATLRSLERSLSNNPKRSETYQREINDMITRNAARKLTKQEIEEYKGPVYYLPHHPIWKESSESTPCRIVLNPSANCGGVILNDFWAKGPDLINNLIGILLRLREGYVAITGDIRKMYHSVRICGVDQHTHRFLWRDLDINVEPEIYAMTVVSFGDRCAGNIAIMALRKTAEMGQSKYPEAAETIKENTYVDDVLDSVDDMASAKKLTDDIDALLEPGNFRIKGWTYTSATEDTPQSSSCTSALQQEISTQNVLGMRWEPKNDTFKFDISLNFAPKQKRTSTDQIPIENININIPLTKRMILSQVNRMYDPLGLIGPFILRAKLLMRKLWTESAKNLGWDDVIPKDHMQEWMNFFNDLSSLNDISFPRCVKPRDAVGEPSLVLFSDGSNDAFGACAYARWEKTCGTFDSQLLISKNRITPIKRITPVRSELCGAVVAKRLKVVIRKEMRLNFVNEYFITDSQIVQAMIKKDSYGFNTFVGLRIGEIQDDASPDDFHWMERCHNIADWVTHSGKTPKDLHENSEWQQGPAFLKLPVSKWPIKIEPEPAELPEQVKTVMKIDGKVEETLADRINLERFSKYYRVIRSTARILALYNRTPHVSLTNACKELTSVDIKSAVDFWIIEAQKTMKAQLDKGDFKRLCPKTNDKGIVVVGGRAEKWFRHRYDTDEPALLPYHHRFTRLYAEQTHIEGGHLAEAATVSKIRATVWIPRIRHMVRNITFHCVPCKKRNRKLEEQRMSSLPLERLKPCPPWTYTSLDFFGPFTTRGEVNKRSRGKAYGVLFTCITCRAVYVDVACDYSTEGFMLALRRFVSIRGFPSIIYSDPGSQLEAASKELQSAVKGLDQEEISAFGINEGLQWKFSPADGPWQNGCSEGLVKSVKRAVEGAVGKQVLSAIELQTVFFEAANLVNERPIGRHPTDPSDGVYLCPNQLILGRTSNKVPGGPFKEHSSLKQRHRLVQNITDSFWRQWTRDYFPLLLVRHKWHTERRNVQVGDVVIVQDANQYRGNWKLASISKTIPSEDGKVRRVELQYKNVKTSDGAKQYTGAPYTTIERPIQRIVVIIPVDEDRDQEEA